MFKCTDCGKEFDTKPEYCDCGNNTFEEILVVKSEQEEFLPPKMTVDKTQKFVQPKSKEYKDNRSILERLQISIYALIFFVMCLVLSVLSVMFLGNGSLRDFENQPKEQTRVLEPVRNIPSINKLWDDSSPEIVTSPPTKLAEPQPIEQSKVQIVQPVQSVQPILQPKVKPVVQSAKPAIKQSTVQQSVLNTKKQSASQHPKNQAYIPKTTSQIASGTSNSQTVQQNVIPTTAIVKTTTTTTKSVTDKATLQKELLSYKVGLRNKIAKNMNFAEVVGDGNCAVTFKIDSVGNLINRKFSVQSNNNSLNDVVYHAVMQNPSYKTPPEGYKNETLTLTVRMYGGNFEVDLR